MIFRGGENHLAPDISEEWVFIFPWWWWWTLKFLKFLQFGGSFDSKAGLGAFGQNMYRDIHMREQSLEQKRCGTRNVDTLSISLPKFI
jgi:hypothetical protein